MDSPKITYKYYSNPAFCAQSEVVYTQQAPCVSPRITASPAAAAPRARRVPPLGAASSPRKTQATEYRDRSGNHRVRTDISDNPLRNSNSKIDGPLRYVSHNQNSVEVPPKPGPKPSRYAAVLPELRRTVVRSSSKTQDQKFNRIIVDPFVRVGSKNNRGRQEEVEMFEVVSPVSETGSGNTEEETEIIRNGRVLKHRYAEIQDDIDDFSPTKKRIVETEPEEYNVDGPSEDENEIPAEIIRSVNGKVHRYAIIPSEEEEEEEEEEEKEQVIITAPAYSPPTFHITSPGMSRKNLEATLKLHELLATPKKQIKKVTTQPKSPLKSCASSPSIRSQFTTPTRAISPDYRSGFPITPSKRIVSSTPKQVMTPSKSCANLASPPLPRRNSNLSSSISPRAQQKLNYPQSPRSSKLSPGQRDFNITTCPDFFVRDSGLNRSKDMDRSYEHDGNRGYDKRGDFNRSRDSGKIREVRQHMVGNRSTAIISPRLVSLGSSIYSSGSTLPQKDCRASPGCATLALAAAMMALCGALSAALSFYIMYTFGRKYYLDIGVLSGFTCLSLGVLGFRTRSHHFLPNRNYVSGYIVLSVFSLLQCAALLARLVGGAGPPLNDIVGGAVSALGALCLLLAGGGALASCCCRRPPPDNRVADV